MKKIALSLLIFLISVMEVSCEKQPIAVPKDDESAVQIKCIAPLPSLGQDTLIFNKEIAEIIEQEPVSISPIEERLYSDDVPLTDKEQEYLQSACEEFDVPYAIVLGLIEKETMFQNVVGDDGASAGYMQIQQKWHLDRMERLGVKDLLEPRGNFRVGCDFLAECYAKYNNWSVALTVYNMGCNPGYITDYAKEVMENYTRWQKVVENYI